MPTTVLYSPEHVESNGTSLAAVAQLVVLADSDAPSIEVDRITAIASCTLIITQLHNQRSIHHVPTIAQYSADHVESNGTSLAAVAQLAAFAHSVAPSIAVDHSAAIASCTLIIT